jgi:hypothetical protein
MNGLSVATVVDAARDLLAKVEVEE